MSIKFPISAVAIATAITLVYSAVANAEVYKTGTNQVVVTGLTAKQKYEVQTVNAKGKSNKRKPATANACGELLVDGAGKMKSVVVGTETIDPATLPIKAHARCKVKKTATAKPIKTQKQPTTEIMGVPAVSPVAVPATSPMPK